MADGQGAWFPTKSMRVRIPLLACGVGKSGRSRWAHNPKIAVFESCLRYQGPVAQLGERRVGNAEVRRFDPDQVQSIRKWV